MKILVIGGTGKIGSYLVPRLVDAGHEVAVMSRGQREPYHSPAKWRGVERIDVDRQEADRAGTFGASVARVGADVVMDLLCFQPESARLLLDELRGRVRHLITCGTISVYGPSHEPPTREDMPRRPVSDYGKGKASMESLLLDAARRQSFPVTILHPGHVVGRGFAPVNPQGNFELSVFEKLKAGQEIVLPGTGTATIHHVHADDLAAAFEAAMNRWNAAVGESFNVASEAAVTLSHYATTAAGWFGQQAKLGFLPFEEFRNALSEEVARVSWDHIRRSPCFSIEKARRVLGYCPRYSSLAAVRDSLESLGLL